MAQRICSVEGCPETHKGHGYCKKHLRRWKKHGDPALGAALPPLANDEARRERARQRASDWYYANRERARANVKAYTAADPERKRQLDREYRLANRERIDQRIKEWHAAHPERVREIGRKHARAHGAKHARIRKARKSCVQIIPFTQEQWEAKVAYWGNRCWICGGEWSEMDHVKPIAAGGAHMLCNLRPACKPCNSGKCDKWPYPVKMRSISPKSAC